MELLKSITGKVAGGIVSLCVMAAGISWWRSDVATRQMLISGAGKIAAWFGIILIVPWASFFLIGRVAKRESNAAAAMLVVGYTILEAVLLAYLFNWNFGGATAWTFAAAAVLLAGVYNLLVCDWIAEKLE
jgi:FtsH-binding integral membrane protein